MRWAYETEARAQGQEIGEGSLDGAPPTVSREGLEYPKRVSSNDNEGDFAEAAGIRIEQAFALCSFASQLVGKALR